MSSSNCCFLSCLQISQKTGQVVWYSHLLKNFPQFVVIHTVKGFGIVNKWNISERMLSYIIWKKMDSHPGSVTNNLCTSGKIDKYPCGISHQWNRVNKTMWPLRFLGFPGGSDRKASAWMWETWVRSLGQEDPLEKEMATHSSTLVWKIPLMAIVHKITELDTTEQLHWFTKTPSISKCSLFL